MSLWLLALALLGALDALYFVAVSYRWVAPDSRIVPAFCRMDSGRCASIIDSRWARVLGLPNAVYGLVWYLGVAVAALMHTRTGTLPACVPLLVGAVASVLLSVVLFWSLVWRLRVPCPLCFAGHAINVAILGSLAWICFA